MTGSQNRDLSVHGTMLNQPSPSGQGHCPNALTTISAPTPLTLGSHQHQRDLARAPVAGHPTVVVVNRLEADFILQAEDKYDSVHPHGKLGREEGEEAEELSEEWGGVRGRAASAPCHLQIITIKLSENKTLGTKNCETGLRRHQDWTVTPFPPLP